MARALEDLGYDSLWFGEHLLYRWRERAPRGPWEAWAMLAGIAAATRRIELGPLVACTAFHNPAVLAKRADTIDEISGGRLILGLGAGWNETEFRAFGIPFDHRIDRFEEAFTIIRGLLQRRRDRLRRALLPGPRLRVAAARAAGRQRRAAADDRLERRADAPDHGPPRRRLELLVRGHRQHAGGRRAAPRQGRRGGAGGRSRSRPRSSGPSPSRSGCRAGPAGRWATATRSRTSRRSRARRRRWPTELRAYAREGIGHVQLVLDPITRESIEGFAPVLAELDRD